MEREIAPLDKRSDKFMLQKSTHTGRGGFIATKLSMATVNTTEKSRPLGIMYSSRRRQTIKKTLVIDTKEKNKIRNIGSSIRSFRRRPLLFKVIRKTVLRRGHFSRALKALRDARGRVERSEEVTSAKLQDPGIVEELKAVGTVKVKLRLVRNEVRETGRSGPASAALKANEYKDFTFCLSEMKAG